MSGRAVAARVGAALLRAILSLCYWSLVMLGLYGLTAGDRRAEIPARPEYMPYVLIIAAVLIHAAMTLLWSSRRRSDAR